MMNWLATMSDAMETVATDLMTTEAASADAFADISLIGKGLMTTLLGLGGVFLVLALFFVTIKAMQRIKVKDEEN